MKPGDSYDDVLREQDRRMVALAKNMKRLAFALAFSGAANLCALILAVSR